MCARVLVLLVVAVATAAAAIAAVPSTTPPPPDPRTQAAAVATHPALSPVLNQLYDSFFGSADPLRRAGLQHLVVDGDSAEVVVVSRPGATVAASERTRQLGGRVTATHRDMVFARVPIARLPMLASDPSVLRIRTPYRSRPDVVSEGVAIHHADGLHGQGITGQGVKVGVLDCGGFSGYEALLGTELPAQITLWTGGSVPVGSSVHGTACAEIVHDMAPGAELFFAHDATEAEFYVAVDWLIAQEVDIISYSCSWTGAFPGDGSGDPYNPVNQKVSDARAAGGLFVVSAGNSADGENYAAWYTLHPGYPNWHSFDGDWGDACDYLHAGDEVDIILTWNDWPADPLTQGSTQDYNMALYYYDGAAWQIPAWSSNPQNGQPGQVPVEEIQFTAAATEWHYVVIYDDGTTAPRFLSLRSFDCDFQYSDSDYSVFTPETPDALNVGAVFWNGLGLEPFSSQGPIFGAGGVPDGGALAPQLVAADGVSTVSYDPSNGTPWPAGDGFFGTSASCPHVAGGVALLLHQNPAFTVDQLEAVLLGAATDMGPVGPDNAYGYGLMNLDAGLIFADGFESGDTAAWSATVP